MSLASRDDIPWVWVELLAVLNIQSQGNQRPCGVELRSNVVLYMQTALVSLLLGSLLIIVENMLEALVVRERVPTNGPPFLPCCFFFCREVSISMSNAQPISSILGYRCSPARMILFSLSGSLVWSHELGS